MSGTRKESCLFISVSHLKLIAEGIKQMPNDQSSLLRRKLELGLLRLKFLCCGPSCFRFKDEAMTARTE